jgi:hypothetical protein
VESYLQPWEDLHFTMNFTIDKDKVTEGDIVELKWDCPGSTMTSIAIDNGYKSATSSVEASGSKRIKLNRSKGRTKFTLTAEIDGKKVVDKLSVRVKKAKAEKVHEAKPDGGYDKYTRLDHNNLKDKFRDFRTKARYAWQRQSEKNRFAIIVLAALTLIMVMSSFAPKFIYFGLLMLAIYVLFSIYKK